MSESGECVILSSGDEEESTDAKGTGKSVSILDGGKTSIRDANGSDDAGSIDAEDDEDDSDCAIVSVDGGLRGVQKWRKVNGPMHRLNTLLRAGHSDPRVLLKRIFNFDARSLPDDPNQLWGLLISLFSEPEPRHRLKHVNSLEKVVELLAGSKNILVVTGAGVSVSCGIPDFRSRDGIYARLAHDYPDLSSPQAMFDLTYFLKNPEPFFKFAKEIFPGQFEPSLTHRFVALLEQRSQLLRNYTQNIDTLEQGAGITRLIQCHGSFATASCTVCKYRVPSAQIKEAIISQTIPRCPKCSDKAVPTGADSVTVDQSPPTSNEGGDTCLAAGVMKPDIVFFGEDLSTEFYDTLAEDIKKTDLVLVIGSSLKVRPVAHIPNAIPEHIPQILINREPLSNHEFDVELLGDCDVIVRQLFLRLGWELPLTALSSTSSDLDQTEKTPTFSYIPFTELPDCPIALKERGASVAANGSSPKMVGASDIIEPGEITDQSAINIPVENSGEEIQPEPKGPSSSEKGDVVESEEITEQSVVNGPVGNSGEKTQPKPNGPGSSEKGDVVESGEITEKSVINGPLENSGEKTQSGPKGSGSSEKGDVVESGEITEQSVINGAVENSGEKPQPEPKGSGSSGDHPVEITDSDDEEDMWMVAASLPAGCFTMISSNQYVFPGAEVSVCKSDQLRLEDTETDDDCSETSSCFHSSTASSPSRVELADNPQPKVCGRGGNQQGLQHLFRTWVKQQHQVAGSSQPTSSSPINVDSAETTQHENSISEEEEAAAGEYNQLSAVSTDGETMLKSNVPMQNVVPGVNGDDKSPQLPNAVGDRPDCDDPCGPVEKRVRLCDSVVDQPT